MKRKSDLTRRQFIASTIAGSGGILALNNIKGVSQLSDENFIKKKSNRDHTVIKVVYVAKPVPTWPCPDIDIDAEMKMINDNLSNLEKLWDFKERDWDFKVKFVGGELLRVPEHFPKFKENIGDVDGIFVFQLTSTMMYMINNIINLGYPMVLFNQPASGHDWASMADLIKQGKKVDVISSSDFGELEPYARIMDAMRRLKQSKIICIRQRTEKDDGIKKMENKYGVEIKLMDYSRINQIFNTIDNKEAEKEAEKFINNAMKVIEPPKEDIISANKFYLAVKKLLEEEKANTMTIDCLGGFNRGDLKAYPCVAWSRLNDEGLTGVCEADLDSTLTSIMLKFYAGGKPGFVTDPFFDTHFNTIVHAHCVSATKMDGLSGESLPYNIRTHMEDNKGVAVQVKMREGQIVTSTVLKNSDTMLVSTAQIIDNSDKNRGCRTKFNCKIIDPETMEEISADKYLHNWTSGLHRVIFYGNLIKDIQKMGRLMEFNVVREV